MRELLLSMLPADLHGARVLDAGCGTGSMAMELARRGADVVAIDLSPSQVEIAARRVAHHLDTFAAGGRIDFRSGDMGGQPWFLRPRGGDGLAHPLPQQRRNGRGAALGRAHAHVDGVRTSRRATRCC